MDAKSLHTLEFDMVLDILAGYTSFSAGEVRAQMPWVRIVHGKGTGWLKHTIHHSLPSNPNVLSWQDGRDGEGGDGATIVKFAEE